MENCRICDTHPSVYPGGTCGDSFCQEAAYYVNRAREFHRQGKQWIELQRLAVAKVMAAQKGKG